MPQTPDSAARPYRPAPRPTGPRAVGPVPSEHRPTPVSRSIRPQSADPLRPSQPTATPHRVHRPDGRHRLGHRRSAAARYRPAGEPHLAPAPPSGLSPGRQTAQLHRGAPSPGAARPRRPHRATTAPAPAKPLDRRPHPAPHFAPHPAAGSKAAPGSAAGTTVPARARHPHVPGVKPQWHTSSSSTARSRADAASFGPVHFTG